MCGSVAFEQHAEGGVVGEGRRVGYHAVVDEFPALLELEELSEDVEYEVEGFGGVVEFEFGFYPVEEFNCALPVVVE